MGVQEGQVQLRDDGVLVVARVAYEGRAVVHDVGTGPLPREVVFVGFTRRTAKRDGLVAEIGDLPDSQLQAVLGIPLRRQAVDAIQLQERRAQVLRLFPYTVQRERLEIGGGQH